MKRRSKYAFYFYVAAFAIIIDLFILSRGVFVKNSEAVQAMTRAGYTHVRLLDRTVVTGLLPEACERNEGVRFRLSGMDADGWHDTVTVCCDPILTGCTVRSQP